MSRWFILTLKWGGLGLAVIFLAALVYVQVLTETENRAVVIAYWVLMLIGLACGFFGLRWERKYLEEGE